MRILHALAQKPGQTGSGIYLNSIVKEADRKHYQQAVIFGSCKSHNCKFSRNVKLYPVHFESDHLPFPVTGMSNEMPYASTRYCDMDEEMIMRWKQTFGKQIDRAIKDFKPDVILAHHLWMLSAFIKQNYPDIPIIAISHGTCLRQLEQSPKIAEYVKKHIHKIDMIFSLNKIQKQNIQLKYKVEAEKIHVLGTGYDSEIFYLKRREHHDSVRMLYAGKLSRAKGVFSLMNTMNKIMIENVILHFIGSSGNKETAALLEKSSDTFHSILFHGSLPQTELAKIFRKNDIFILPSFYEGLPLVLIEAIASGMNVVVSDLPGIRDFLGDEYCASPFVSFVPLPRLKNVDQPFSADLPKFEAFLKTAIETQIYNIADHLFINKDLVERTVKKWTWQKLFERLEIHLQKLL